MTKVMTYHVTAPRLLFLYPRVARVALPPAPDTRGQIIFPRLTETDRDAASASASASAKHSCGSRKGKSDSRARCTHDSRGNNCGRWETVIAGRASHGFASSRMPREKGFHTATSCQQSLKPQRYGKANEPPPYLDDKKKGAEQAGRDMKDDLELRKEKEKEKERERGQRAVDGSGISGAEGSAITVEGKQGKEAGGQVPGKRNEPYKDKSRSMPGQQHLFRADGRLVEDSPDNETDEDMLYTGRMSFSTAGLRSKQGKIDRRKESDESVDDHEPDDHSSDSNSTTQPSLQTILQAQSSERRDNSPQKKLLLRKSKNAHLSSSSSSSSLTPRSPYFHHFDTYSMARNLQDGGFSEKQAVTTMKAMRLTLAENLEWANEGLVSKSNVENDTYLFRAACSELRTEVQSNRKKAADRMRNDRNQLEHEAEILNQLVQQESQNLKDNLKGIFGDRRMAVRMEQKEMESKIQELDYTITVALRSDARSAVEGLRWILVRRAAIAIVISAVMILATLRYSSYMTHTQELERQKMKASQHNNNSHNLSPADYDPSDNSPSTDRPLSDTGHKSKSNGEDEEIMVRAQEVFGVADNLCQKLSSTFTMDEL